MEELLSQVITISSNFPQIEKAAREAADFLSIQQGFIRDPAHELREKCLFVLQLCLETKKSKFLSIATTGFQKILRDDRFHSNFEPDDDSKWLLFQLLQATACFLHCPDDTKVDILKVILNIAYSRKSPINGRTVISILCLCSEAFQTGNAAVRSAAQAAGSQILSSYCLNIHEYHEDNDKYAANYNEILPIMQFICSKIDVPDCIYSSMQSENEVIFFLECLLTLCLNLPNYIHSNIHLRTFFWQKLCPVLISVLGTPRIDRNIVTRVSSVEKERGRGSGGLNAAPNYNSAYIKTIYCINLELVRLFATVAPLRPVLESLFHRILLYPPADHRLEALKIVSEILGNPARLLDLCGPITLEEGSPIISDLSFLRLIMDSVEESSFSTYDVTEASVSNCLKLLRALEQIVSSNFIPSNVAEKIAEMYPTLIDSDYEGPQVYQTASRLPQYYKERLLNHEELLKQSEKNQVFTEEEFLNSDSSEDTEGPQKEELIDSENELELNNVISSPFSLPMPFGNTARQGARHFVEALNDLLPLLMPLRSSIQIDQALQSFASQYCEDVNKKSSTERYMAKAEGFYLAIYSGLLLDMHLLGIQFCRYPRKSLIVCLSEDDFLTKAKGVGVKNYLSDEWLREFYQLIVSSSLLKGHGYFPFDSDSQPHALINLLTDVEGLGTYQKGSQMLWECRRLLKSIGSPKNSVEKNAGLRLSRRILTCSWDTTLKVLAVPLTEKRYKRKGKKFQDIKFLRQEEKWKNIRQSINMSIEGLQILSVLCTDLELQARCSSILELLAKTSCNDTKFKKSNFFSFQIGRDETIRLTPTDSLSLELLLSSGLELGSHCSDCWPHVFRCCVYVKKLEHKYFSKSENRILGSTGKLKRKNSSKSTKSAKLTFDPDIEEDVCVDVYSFLYSSEQKQTVSELLSTIELEPVDNLKPSDTAKVICILSQLVDKFFEDAAMKLNLKSLESFSSCLCACSRKQLFASASFAPKVPKNSWWHKFSKELDGLGDTLLLDFAGEIMLKSVRSGRPLFHVMKIWEIIVTHLIEAACHKDLIVSRKAMRHMHDTINATLTEHPEISNFHTTESFFKPFEILLCQEMCEADIQDRIVGCICEFVEANFKEIRSGWRPLFGALRAASTDINALSDALGVFLDIDDISVFSYAAVDYIMCLIKHLKLQSNSVNSEFNLKTLKFFKRCQSILYSTYVMDQSITFHAANHIQISDGLLVDPVVPDLEALEIEIVDDISDVEEIDSENLNFLTYLLQFECKPSLDSIDRTSGVLRVWFLLLEGIFSAAISANSAFQSLLLNELYDDIQKLLLEPGPVFGLIILNRLALPMTQSWLRQLTKIQEGDSSGLKHSMGLLSDSVVYYFDRLRNNQICQNLLDLLLSQTLLLLTECSVHSIPTVAKIGPACIRHIIANVGYIFTCEQWKIATVALYRLCNITTLPLRQLMTPFSKDSNCFYGDSNQVKVAVRRASSSQEVHYSYQLSHRVFLLDEQHENVDSEIDYDDFKEYLFLISKSKDNDDDIVRIPVKRLVSALHAHQSVLQIVADIILFGAKYKMSSLTNLLTESNYNVLARKTENRNDVAPGLMNSLTPSALARLLLSLDHSYRCAVAFDSRPGLKFLIQRVTRLQQAANLYRQGGCAWAIKLISLFDYCSNCIESNDLTHEDIKKLLEGPLSNLTISYFLNKFRKCFDELCSTYVHVMSNDYEEVCSRESITFFLLPAQGDAGSDAHSSQPDHESLIKDFRSSCQTVSSDLPKDPETEVGKGDHQSFYCDRVEKTKAEGSPLQNFSQSEPDAQEEEKENGNSFQGSSPNEEKEVEKPLVPPEIEQQRRNSFLKDGEALRRVWTQMLTSVVELLLQMDERDFRRFLPVFTEGAHQLRTNLPENSLKQVVLDFFQRVDASREASETFKEDS